MAYPYTSHQCDVLCKGSFVFQGTAGLCAGELLYYFTQGQPHNSDDYGDIVKMKHEVLVQADSELPTEDQAYLRWAAEKRVKSLEDARRWTVGDFKAVRDYIAAIAKTDDHLWLDYQKSH